MMLRVTDLMIEAATKKKPRRKPPECKGKTWPPGCLPHTAPRCRTCTGITAATGHFTTGDTCVGQLDVNTVRGELLSQLRATLADARSETDRARAAA
jgi:hypothetical protein